MSTSRIGRKPVNIPAGVEVKLDSQTLSAKGPKGQLSMTLHPFIHVTMENKEIKIQPNTESKKNITGLNKKLYRSIAGTIRASINNIMHGVTHGFEYKLVLVGIGYRAQAKGNKLSLSLGFSHPTDFVVPAGITVATPSQTEIVVKGVDRELVGLVAAQIRRIRPPEAYKGKGIRYADEKIELKETKKK